MIDFESHIFCLNEMQFSDLLFIITTSNNRDDEIFRFFIHVVVFNHLTDFCFIVSFSAMRVFLGHLTFFIMNEI